MVHPRPRGPCLLAHRSVYTLTNPGIQVETHSDPRAFTLRHPALPALRPDLGHPTPVAWALTSLSRLVKVKTSEFPGSNRVTQRLGPGASSDDVAHAANLLTAGLLQEECAPCTLPRFIHGIYECKVLESLLSEPNTPNAYSAISRIGWVRYLGSKSDNLLGDSFSPAFRELLNDVDTESTSPDDREICVSLYLV